MESNDILLTIDPKSTEKGIYSLSIETLNGKLEDLELIIHGFDMEPNVLPTGPELGFALYEVFVAHRFLDQLNDLTLSKVYYQRGSFLLVINPQELFQLPWEEILTASPFLHLQTSFKVIRFLTAPSLLALKRLKLPIDVLVVSPADPDTQRLLPTENTLRYFSATKTSGISGHRFNKLMNQLEFDIVHITGRAKFDKTHGSIILSGDEDSPVRPGVLLSLLEKCGARLLILHCLDDSIAAFRHFAHLVFNQNGPVILMVSQSAVYPGWPVDQLYFDIVHDIPLDQLFNNLPEYLRPSLFLASGATDLLRISTLQSGLSKRVEDKFLFSRNIMDSLYTKMLWTKEKGDLETADQLQEQMKDLDMFLASNRNEVAVAFDYSHESGGMEPLKQIERINEKIGQVLKEAEAVTKRVVNCWFDSGEEKIKSTQHLDTDSSYNYNIQIGIAIQESIVQNAIAFPDKELSPYFSEDGIPLRVELFSKDFIIPESSRELILPKPPGESERLVFQVRTPVSEGMARLRVCIYYKQNLVQSLIIQSAIGKPVAGHGNTAEVDFSLSNTFLNLDRLPPRTLNIALNDSNNGTHSLFIAGVGLKSQFDFGEGEISTYLNSSRTALQDICRGKEDGKPAGYRFDTNNKGNEKDFITEVINLARLGSKLYYEIIMNRRDRAFQDQLRLALERPGASIQISSTRSAKYVFPWALVYDKPLILGNNTVCSQFLGDMKKSDTAGFLGSQACLQNGCVNKADKSIICPSEFWGFKHIIEQPLSTDPNKLGVNELPLQIRASANSAVMMCVSLDLNDVDKHLEEIKKLYKVDVQFMESKQKIGIGLDRDDIHLVYFYCHGGRDKQDTWLGVGKSEKIIPPELIAWDVRWQVEHPFVFINGCHTADATPSDFVQFNDAFAYCEAAGVMGTEISVTEGLARHFASGFLQRFLNGTNVGEALRDQRLTMLKNYNLLGLAYTPYCSADLKIIYT